jgi:5-methylcytosine-specific restriction endonuclease McrA
MHLKVIRDLERKKFCSRKCLGRYTVKHKLPKDHMYTKVMPKSMTPEANAKKSHKGEKHPSWIKDRSKVKNKRCLAELSWWRKAIFERDNYTCQFCKKRGGQLNADHIKPYSMYPELRADLSNGRTLCVDCHKKTDTYGLRLVWQLRRQNECQK